MNTFNIKAAAAVATLAAGLAAALPMAASADTTTTPTVTTNPAVTAPPVQGTTPRNVNLYVDTVSATFHGTVPAGSVQGTCGITHHFVQGQTVVFRMWGTAADGTPLTGPNATNIGNVKSAVVSIQTPGGGAPITEPLSYSSHPSGASYWTAPWPTSTATPIGAVNYTVTVQTYDVPPVYKNEIKKIYRLAYRKVRSHRKAYLKVVKKPVKVVVTPGIAGPTGTFSSSGLADMPDQALTIIKSGTAPTSW